MHDKQPNIIPPINRLVDRARGGCAFGSVLNAFEAMDQTAIPLVRTNIKRNPKISLLSAPSDLELTFLMAFFGFFIELRRFISGSSLEIQPGHSNMKRIGLLGDRELGADRNVLAGFTSMSVDMNLTAVDRFDGELSCLEESGGPKPLIESHAGGMTVGWN